MPAEMIDLLHAFESSVSLLKVELLKLLRHFKLFIICCKFVVSSAHLSN